MNLHLLNNCNEKLSESTFTTNFRNKNLGIHLRMLRT